MLIKFPDLISRYNIQPQGIVHCGASRVQEAEAYYSSGVKRTIWIEALESLMPDIRAILSKYPSAIALNACIGSEDDKDVIFNVSSNDGESSSYLEFGIHEVLHPDVRWIDHIPMKTKRIDTLLQENDLDLEGFDLFNCDVQGVELQALKSLGHLLHNFKWLYLEVNKNYTYRDNALVDEIDEYVSRYGFTRIETAPWIGDTWTDAFYMKSNTPAA